MLAYLSVHKLPLHARSASLLSMRTAESSSARLERDGNFRASTPLRLWRSVALPHGGSCTAQALSAHMARCSRCTPPGGRRAPPRPRSWSVTCSESAAAPVRLHAKSEPSVTISSQVHLQLAYERAIPPGSRRLEVSHSHKALGSRHHSSITRTCDVLELQLSASVYTQIYAGCAVMP